MLADPRSSWYAPPMRTVLAAEAGLESVRRGWRGCVCQASPATRRRRPATRSRVYHLDETPERPRDTASTRRRSGRSWTALVRVSAVHVPASACTHTAQHINDWLVVYHCFILPLSASLTNLKSEQRLSTTINQSSTNDYCYFRFSFNQPIFPEVTPG